MLPIYKRAANHSPQDPEPKAASGFGNFSKSVLDELEQVSYPIRYPGGFVLFAEGDAPRGVFILRSGRVKVFICSGDGKILILRFSNPGDVLGLPATLSGRTYEVTAETLGPCELAFIKREPFLRFMQTNNEICRAVAEQLVSIYSSTCHEIRCIGLHHSVCEKLAQLLLDWPLSNGDKPCHVKIALTHEEIAQLIGTSRETVSRLLAEFKRKHIAELNGSTLHIQNRAALQSLAAGKRLMSLSEETAAEQDWDGYFQSGGP